MTAATVERHRLPVAVPAAITLAWAAAMAAHATGVAARFHQAVDALPGLAGAFQFSILKAGWRRWPG